MGYLNRVMHDFTIRLATVADIPTLIYHRRSMWLDMGRRGEEAFEVMEAAADEYFHIAIPKGLYRGYLAEVDSRVVGGGGLVISPWPGQLRQRKPYRAMILNIYVEKEFRRRGIARAIMETMITWCRENEFVNVGLHASDEGRPLYEKLGFKPTNEMRLDL